MIAAAGQAVVFKETELDEDDGADGNSDGVRYEQVTALALRGRFVALGISRYGGGASFDGSEVTIPAFELRSRRKILDTDQYFERQSCASLRNALTKAYCIAAPRRVDGPDVRCSIIPL